MIYKGVLKKIGVCVVRGLAAAPVGGEPASAESCVPLERMSRRRIHILHRMEIPLI